MSVKFLKLVRTGEKSCPVHSIIFTFLRNPFVARKREQRPPPV